MKRYQNAFGKLTLWLLIAVWISFVVILAATTVIGNAAAPKIVEQPRIVIQTVFDFPHNTTVPKEGSARIEIPTSNEADVFLRRPNGRGDGDVRVMPMLISTRIDEMTCHSTAAGYLSGIPVNLIAYGARYSHIKKPGFFLETADLAGLSGDDIILIFDSDAVFTGMDPLPFLDEFILDSPASLQELDVRAIREGRSIAPFLISGEADCYTPQFSTGHCFNAFFSMHNATARYADEHGLHYGPRTNISQHAQRYVNGGVAVARVWALREVIAAIDRYIDVHSPLGRYPKNPWFCDQTVVAALYLQLRAWELSSDAMLVDTAAVRMMLSPYGLHGGIIGLDHMNKLSSTLSVTGEGYYELTTNSWFSAVAAQKTITENIPSTISFDYGTRREIDNMFRIMDGNNTLVHTRLSTGLKYTPPLLSLRPRPIDVVDGVIHRVFPLIVHFAGYRSDEKTTQSTRAMPYMQWFVPMAHNRDTMAEGRDYVMSRTLEVWSLTNRTRVQYSDVCGQSLTARLSGR